MNFPLYDNMLKDLDDSDANTDLSLKQKREFVKTIKMFDTSGKEMIYALIRVHQLKYTKFDKKDILPFNGKFTKDKHVKFNLEILPIQLKHILYNFSVLHKKTMNK